MKTLLFLICIINSSFLLANDGLSPDLSTYNSKIKPLLDKYCVDCHGPKKVKGKMRLDTIDPDILKGDHAGKWEDILEQFNTGEMPPEDEKQPTPAEREIFSLWLDQEFHKARRIGSPNRKGAVRRLTRYELQYSLEDMFNVSAEDEVKSLPEESQSAETGLKNSSKRLIMSGPHLESYFNVIFSMIHKVKEIISYKPFTAKMDIANLKIPIPKKKKNVKSRAKSHFQDVEKIDKILSVKPGGHITLNIPSIPKCLFKVSFSAQARNNGAIQISMGYKNSPNDRKEFSRGIAIKKLTGNKAPQNYIFEASTEVLPYTLRRASNREFFVRLTNSSKETISINSFSFTGNLNKDIKEAIIDPSVSKSNKEAYIKGVISTFTAKAFRRELSENELLKYYNIFLSFSKKMSGMKALLSTYEEILCSPKFFYMALPGETTKDQNSNYRLAEKLSYFLWCSIPDEALINDAKKGLLTKSHILTSHIKRMLKDPRSKRMVENFTDQWLHTSQLFNVAVDNTYYRGFKDSLKVLMRQETIESVNDVFRNGAPAVNLLKADHVFVNDTLAKFYKIRGVQGAQFKKVQIKESDNRGGLLTQGTFLIGNSDGINSHAILRGVWLTEIILDNPPPAPPKNVPPFDETIPGFDKMTLNQKMFIHRNNDACRSCHKKIDPWGIPFENYDASGAWRSKVLLIAKTENAPKGKKAKKEKEPKVEKTFIDIERKSILPSTVAVDGMQELKDYLIKNKKTDFSKGLTKKLLAFALSRDLDFYDAELIKKLNEKFISKNYSVPTLITEIVLSESFQKGGK